MKIPPKKKESNTSDISRPEDKGQETYMLETTVIDTGIGISPDRQRMLFIPFLELKTMQGLKQAKNDTIGLGLSGSREITHSMGGDIRLKKSEAGLTVFTFKVPVKMRSEESNSLEDSIGQAANRIFSHQTEKTIKKDFLLFGKPRKMK